MPTDQNPTNTPPPDEAKDRAIEQRRLTPAAERALAEAAARRAQREAADQQTEVHGRGGLDPTRYGDWEINGLISDF